jgi:hypothetical protein
MKRLLILAIVSVLTATTVGCGGCGGWFRRGPHCDTCPSTGPYGAAPISSAPAETYLPAPG